MGFAKHYTSADAAANQSKVAETAVQSWYDEVKNYSFKTGKSKSGGVTGHFTQVTWYGKGKVIKLFRSFGIRQQNSELALL